MAEVTAYAIAKGTSPKWCRAFAAGSGGDFVKEATALQPGAVAMFGYPWSLLNQAIAEGRDWYYGDHAYFGRFTYYRVTRNAYQHAGRGKGSPTRFRRFGIEIRPWRRSGGHVLVCPPDDEFSGLHQFSSVAWTENVVAELSRHTDRPLRVRGRLNNKAPLAADLEGCWALVTYTSNAAVEAVLAGVPVFCTGQCAGLTMGLGDLSKIEQPRYPDGRFQWASVLAANQWTLAEMESGATWRAIGR